MSKIYVLVEVGYDYFRFQVNLEANLDRGFLVEYAKGLNFPLLEYTAGDSLCTDLDKKEVFHLWIQEFGNEG